MKALETKTPEAKNNIPPATCWYGKPVKKKAADKTKMPMSPEMAAGIGRRQKITQKPLTSKNPGTPKINPFGSNISIPTRVSKASRYRAAAPATITLSERALGTRSQHTMAKAAIHNLIHRVSSLTSKDAANMLSHEKTPR
jgi:hypothetical protein